MREIKFNYTTSESSWDASTCSVVLELHAYGYDVAQNSSNTILVDELEWGRVLFLLLKYTHFTCVV
jgi:hypothetical protein